MGSLRTKPRSQPRAPSSCVPRDPLPPSPAPTVNLAALFPGLSRDPVERKRLALIEQAHELAIGWFKGLEAMKIPRDDIVIAVIDPKDALGACITRRLAVEARSVGETEANLKKRTGLMSPMPLACARRAFYDEPAVLAFFKEEIPEGTGRVVSIAEGGVLTLFLPT